MDRRTPDEMVSYIEGFLNELYTHFSPNGRVSFKELSIKKRGKAYRLRGRLRCEIMKAEFDEAHRFYKRKYDTPPTKEVILSWIDAARELECNDKRRVRNDANKRDKVLAREKERRKGRKEQIRVFNYNYYKKNKPKIDAKFKADKYYEKNRDRINRRRNERRARERIRRAKILEGRKVVESMHDFDTEFEKVRAEILKYFKWISTEYDDLIQDVYLEGKGSFKRYNGMSKFTTWLIRIGINLNLQRLKKHRIEKNNVVFVGEFNEDTMANAVGKISLEELLEEENKVVYPENTIEIIYDAMDELTMKDKQLLELYMNGNKHGKIAEILNISEDYSKTRLYLIRSMLAKKVEPLLNIKIKTYGNADPTGHLNRNASKKTYYFRNKVKKVS